MLEVGENFVVLNMVQNVPANNVFKKFAGNTSQRNCSLFFFGAKRDSLAYKILFSRQISPKTRCLNTNSLLKPVKITIELWLSSTAALFTGITTSLLDKTIFFATIIKCSGHFGRVHFGKLLYFLIPLES